MIYTTGHSTASFQPKPESINIFDDRDDAWEDIAGVRDEDEFASRIDVGDQKKSGFRQERGWRV
jgi:hypothetical protein